MMSLFIDCREIKKYKEIIKNTLQNDGLIIYPTDTIYGLGCNAFSKRAYEKICKLKKIDFNTPLIILVSSKKEAFDLVEYPKNKFYKIAKAFWPGPLTIIARAKKDFPSWIIGKDFKIAIRYPNNEIAKFIAKCIEKPIISTSANIHKEIPCSTAEEAYKIFGDSVDIYIEGVRLSGSASTLIDITTSPVSVLRQGAIPITLIEEKMNI